MLKAQFLLPGGPEELLKVLLDEKVRKEWDFGLVKAEQKNNKMNVSYLYENCHYKFSETIEFSYMVF